MDDFSHARLAEDEPRNPFDLKVLVLYALARFRNQIIALGVLGAILGLIFAASQPNSYAVLTRLRLKPSVRQLMSEEAVYGVNPDEPFRVRSSYALNEELELLRDPQIFDRVVDEIGPEYILTVADPRAGDGPGTSFPVRYMHALQAGLIHVKGLDNPCPDGVTPEAKRAAADRLKANLTVRNPRNTNLIDVKYTDSSPAKAKRIGDEIVRQMRRKHLETFSAVGSMEVLKASLDEAFQEYKFAQNELLKFKDQCGFKDLANDLRTTNEQINLKEIDLEDKNIQLNALNATVREIESDLKISTGTGDETIDVQTMRPNPEFRKARTAMETMQDQLSTLRIEYPEPTGIILDQIESLEAKIANQERTLSTLNPMVPKNDLEEALGEGFSEQFAEVIARLYEARSQRKGLMEEVNGIAELIVRLRQKQRAMEECQVEYEARETILDSAKQKRDRLIAQRNRIEGLETMEKDDVTNLSVARASRLPIDKEGPQRSKPLMMGLIGGLAFGAGLSVLRQLLDRRVRYLETIENSLGLRVLCVVPDLGGKTGFDARQEVA